MRSALLTFTVGQTNPVRKELRPHFIARLLAKEVAEKQGRKSAWQSGVGTQLLSSFKRICPVDHTNTQSEATLDTFLPQT